jgi:2-polyprenyl-3-methyl-5-hydroxy-6-metoxy-1,4-benzoquinol methylase
MTEYFLPVDYVLNGQASHEIDNKSAFWRANEIDETFQVPVYRLAATLASQQGLKTVLDVGCGTGKKLVTHVEPHVTTVMGVDQASGIAFARQNYPSGTWIEGDLSQQPVWATLAEAAPALVICADVIEHVDDPAILLDKLQRLISSTGGKLLISTPDRSLIESPRLMGPPHNVRHVREWTKSEFSQLLESRSFKIEQSWYLRPRTYASIRDAVRAVYRMLNGRHPFDNAHAMAFLVTAA